MGVLYAKVAGAWTEVTGGGIVPAPGPTGPTGPASTVPGPTGPTGPAGADSTVAGPTGPAGPSAVSVDAGNTAVLGTDSLVFVPATTFTETFTQVQADPLYANITGDTMTGPLTINADTGPQLVLDSSLGADIVLKRAGVEVGGFYTSATGLQIGGTSQTVGPGVTFSSSVKVMTTLELGLDPAQPMEAATKQYTDTAITTAAATKWTMWSGTQVEYDAIVTKDPATLYVITPAPRIGTTPA